MVHVLDIDIATEPGLTGCSVISLVSGGQIYSLIMDGAYIEDHSPLTLITATTGWATNGIFKDINYVGEVNEQLMNMTGLPSKTYMKNSKLTFRDINFGNIAAYVLTKGVVPSGFTTANLHIDNVQGPANF